MYINVLISPCAIVPLELHVHVMLKETLKDKC